MKRKSTLFFLMFLIFSTIAVKAQSFKITGTVKDETGTTLPGVSIGLRGTTIGTQTDPNGQYSITALSATNQTLVISYIGYITQEIKADGKTVINVTLKIDKTDLQEVVVVGYGTQKVTKISGAIATVKGADIEKLNPVRAEDAIQGRASGVTVISPGSPGAKPTFLIRGIPSYSGNDPIVVVDGSIQSLDDLNSIQAADIESISILKDAATTAIYGIKGGNGVIVVTTKSGRANQKPQYSYGSNYGIQQVINTIGVLNASEYGAIINEGSTVSGGNIIFPNLSTLGVGTNWQDQVFNNAAMQSHNVNAKGGNENITYFISAGYLGQDGIVGGGDKSFFNRTNGTANLTLSLSKKLRVIANTSFVNIKGSGIPENSINSVLSNALNFDPTTPIFNTVPNTTGTYAVSNNILSEIFNPLTQLENTYNESNTNKLYGKLEGQYDILKNLKVTARYGYTNTDVTGKSFNPLVFYGTSHINSTLDADGNTRPGSNNNVSEYKTTYFNYTFENFVNYNFKVTEDHSFDLLGGYSLAKVTGNSVNGSRQDVPFNSWDYADISSATGLATNNGLGVGSFQYENRNMSYFGRVNYDYKEKYLASFSGRRDGSTTFGKNNRFANFYAGSLGWVVSQEDFFKSDFFNFLKIRGSYGVTGNDNAQRQVQRISQDIYSYNLGQNSGYTFGNDPTLAGATIGSFKNEDLSWERQKQLNVGFDLVFFKNKFSLTADYFQKNVDGLLFIPTLSLYLGTAASPFANIGTTNTKGVDINLGFNDNITKDLKITTNITFTTAKNEVTETNGGRIDGGFYGIPTQNVTRFEKGFTPGYFFGYQAVGLFQNTAEIAASPTQSNAKPGDIKFADTNGDNVINDLDRTKIGDPFPNFTMGYSLGFNYKNLDFNTFVYASFGNDIFRAYERNLAMTNKFRSVLGRWTGEGSTNNPNTPRYAFTDGNVNTRVSSRYVEDGSFAKIKDIQLGYTLPASLIKSKVISRLRLFAQVKNAYTFTKYSGFDPEIAGGILDSGIDRASYPQARTFSMGLDVKF
jgi:TonB-linked SusC/RagA family outer membrane protein